MYSFTCRFLFFRKFLHRKKSLPVKSEIYQMFSVLTRFKPWHFNFISRGTLVTVYFWCFFFFNFKVRHWWGDIFRSVVDMFFFNNQHFVAGEVLTLMRLTLWRASFKRKNGILHDFYPTLLTLFGIKDALHFLVIFMYGMVWYDQSRHNWHECTPKGAQAVIYRLIYILWF